jgi:hypothetical protein
MSADHVRVAARTFVTREKVAEIAGDFFDELTECHLAGARLHR